VTEKENVNIIMTTDAWWRDGVPVWSHAGS